DPEDFSGFSMFSKKKIIVMAGAGLVLVTSAAGVVYKLNGKPADPARPSGSSVDSIAASSEGESSGSTSELFIPVEGEAVVQDTLVLAVSAAGQVAPWRQAIITAQVEGQVRTVGVAENAGVSAGAGLVAVNTEDYELALKEAEASLRTAEAQYRETTLFDERITDGAVRAERQKAARAKSGLDRAEVAVQKAKLELSRSRLRAPFAGRVANVKVQPGQWVRPGDELMTVVELSRVKVDVQVLEGQIAFLTPGRTARVHFAAFPDESFVGRIETINPMVDQSTRSARVVVSVANPEGKLLPGMYARVSLDARRFADRILVPRSAILERDRRKMLFVFAPGEEGSTRGFAKWRYVTTGLENDDVVEILPSDDTEMVSAGEIVLTGGHHTLVHDARVRITEKADTASNARPL
ncbi:MAG TPA: efflux RND transporter periplasmic adaptor subunit, partial [Longimicrobiales bacterium]